MLALLQAVTPHEMGGLGLLDASRLDAEERRAIVAHLDLEGWTIGRLTNLLSVSESTIRQDRATIRRRRGIALAGLEATDVAADVEARFARLIEKEMRLATQAENAVADALLVLREHLPPPGTSDETRRAHRLALRRREFAAKEAAANRKLASDSFRQVREIERARIRALQDLGIVRKQPDVLLVAAEMRSQREEILRAVKAVLDRLDLTPDQRRIAREGLLSLPSPEDAA